jgi:porin
LKKLDQRFDNTGRSLADPLSTGIPLNHTGDLGFYGVVDQMLYRLPGTDNQGLSAFFRAGGVPDDRNLINFYADGRFFVRSAIGQKSKVFGAPRSAVRMEMLAKPVVDTRIAVHSCTSQPRCHLPRERAAADSGAETSHD